jgi:hypothetical protein
VDIRADTRQRMRNSAENVSGYPDAMRPSLAPNGDLDQVDPVLI